MQVESGKIYRNGYGARVKVVDVCQVENIYPVCGLEWDERFQSFYWPHKYTRDGKWGVDLANNSSADLVEVDSHQNSGSHLTDELSNRGEHCK